MGMIIERRNVFFIQRVKIIDLPTPDEEKGSLIASQPKRRACGVSRAGNFKSYIYQSVEGLVSKRLSPKMSEAFAMRRTPLQFDIIVIGSLRLVDDHFCRRLAHLELRAHFLNLRRLLFQLRNHRLHFAL